MYYSVTRLPCQEALLWPGCSSSDRKTSFRRLDRWSTGLWGSLSLRGPRLRLLKRVCLCRTSELAGDAIREGQCSRRFSRKRLCSISLLADGLTEGEEPREARLKGETERRRERPLSVLDSSGRRFLELGMGMMRSRVRPRDASCSGGGTTVILMSWNDSVVAMAIFRQFL